MSTFPSTVYIAEIYGLITGETPHLALYTTNPTAAGTGTEVTGGSYARQPITFGSITGGSISNSAVISFTGVPTATITHWGIKDALTGGDLKVYGALTSSIASVSGDEVQFPIGNLQINLAGS